MGMCDIVAPPYMQTISIENSASDIGYPLPLYAKLWRMRNQERYYIRNSVVNRLQT